MNRALQPLADLPGVRVVMMVTEDGVPIAVPGKLGPDPGQEAIENNALGQEDAIAAMAIGWLNDLSNEVGAMSWGAPERICMKAARGTLVVQRTRGAFLLVILSRGLDPENVRLPMNGALARIERGLRNMGGGSDVPDSPPPFRSGPAVAEPASHAAPAPQPEPPGALPTGHKSIPLHDPAEVNPFDSQEPSGK